MAAKARMTAAQRELLAFMAAHRCQHGIWTDDRHYEATTFESLRKKRLIGLYLPRQRWMASRYKITPLGRAALLDTTFGGEFEDAITALAWRHKLSWFTDEQIADIQAEMVHAKRNRRRRMRQYRKQARAA